MVADVVFHIGAQTWHVVQAQGVGACVRFFELGPVVCKGIYEDLPKVHGKNGENPGENFDFYLIFQGFSGPDFAKTSAAVLRIDLVRSRAPETNI